LTFDAPQGPICCVSFQDKLTLGYNLPECGTESESQFQGQIILSRYHNFICNIIDNRHSPTLNQNVKVKMKMSQCLT